MRDRGLNALFIAPRVPTAGININRRHQKVWAEEGDSVRGSPINHTKMSIATVCSGKSRNRPNKSTTETTGVT